MNKFFVVGSDRELPSKEGYTLLKVSGEIPFGERLIKVYTYAGKEGNYPMTKPVQKSGLNISTAF